jgi:hypothetical protein
MLSLTIAGLQGIIPKLMALQRGWFRYARKGLRKICLTRNKEDFDLALPYIAMGYKMSKHASLSHFSPYFPLCWKQPIPPSSIITQMDQVVDLDCATTWARVITNMAILFGRVMPMAMENLSIA